MRLIMIILLGCIYYPELPPERFEYPEWVNTPSEQRDYDAMIEMHYPMDHYPDDYWDEKE